MLSLLDDKKRQLCVSCPKRHFTIFPHPPLLCYPTRSGYSYFQWKASKKRKGAGNKETAVSNNTAVKNRTESAQSKERTVSNKRAVKNKSTSKKERPVSIKKEW